MSAENQEGIALRNVKWELEILLAQERELRLVGRDTGYKTNERIIILQKRLDRLLHGKETTENDD